MSDSVEVSLEPEEAKELYRLLARVSALPSGDRLARLRLRLERSLFERLSIEEMEILVESDDRRGVE